jgi:hypothetical protein
MDELEEERSFVYHAAIELIRIKGLDNFMDFLQEVEESGAVPKSCLLDSDTYVAVLRRAANDYRKKLLSQQ